jgi:diacylglycerol kinase family enzyme
MLDRFQKVLILINPASTGARHIRYRVEELQSLFPEKTVIVVKMTSKKQETTSDILVAHAADLGPNTLLGIGAGDGTTSVIVETLVRDKRLPEKARSTVVIPLWGGNANDLANMLNGSAEEADLSIILNYGKIVPIYPLYLDFELADHTHVSKIAVCNASFGATAYVAVKLNGSRFRTSRLHKYPGGRMLKETMTAVNSLLRAPTFNIEDNGVEKIVYERMFSNGSRFAKFYQMPVELNEKQVYVNTIEGKRIMTILLLLLSGSFSRFSTDHQLSNDMKFIIKTSTQSQFDGETWEIPAHTEVEAHISDQPFYALTTLLKVSDV